MSVDTLLACGSGCFTFTISTRMDSCLIMVALDPEFNLWRRFNGKINIPVDLIDVSTISQILARACTTRVNHVKQITTS